ncbi:hypothetical protein K458DRAFT_1802 [Lentithecium fluviatile CBS 122367]|uniref:Uncharacterized protein n=1 Tax=Lentithecium fluviatile CBS 122367 TaxID=1168545 RepID=A0A6G1JMQ7_9PLEO|nr:hypothetical protein K458DRAFT_1802 [Lentithecium fluviatile CBS 122367]
MMLLHTFLPPNRSRSQTKRSDHHRPLSNLAGPPPPRGRCFPAKLIHDRVRVSATALPFKLCLWPHERTHNLH